MLGEEIIEIPGKWEIPYLYSAGKTASKFFYGLKHNKKIMGTKCKGCSRVYLPPRSYCETCFLPIIDWVEVGEKGIVETFTIVLTKFEGFPEPPFIISYVRLEGADTCLANFISGVDLTDIEKAKKIMKVGMRVKVLFKDNPEGRITDFVFAPINP